jgi:hypothetical protein
MHDHGYSFNAGNRIEVCSSLTWLYLLILLLKSGFNILVASKILGIVLGCLSLFIIYAITKCFTQQMPWVILPAFLTSASIPFLFWNQMGLETALYTLILLSLILICLKQDRFIYWPVLSLLLVLTRPEGIFLLVGLLPVFYVYRDRRKTIIRSSLLLIVLFLTIIILRLFYFHDFLPSPFYTKIYPGKSLEGFFYIHSFFKSHYMYIFLLPFLYMVWKKWNWEKGRTFVFGFMVSYLLWVVWGGSEGIFKPFFRHLVPVIPVIYIYTITGIEKIFESSKTVKRAVAMAILLLGFITLLLPRSHTPSYELMPNPIISNIKCFFNDAGSYWQLFRNRLQDPAKFNQASEGINQQILLGEFIKGNYINGSTLLYDQMGQTPYQAGIEYLFIDSWGLTDKVIGRYYFHERVAESRALRLYERISSYIIKKLFPEEEFIYTKDAILDYIFRQNSDVMFIFSITCYLRDYLPHWIIMDSRFKNSYHPAYFIHGTLVFEKNGLKKNPLYIPDGLSVVFNRDIYKALNDDPLIQRWGKMTPDAFWNGKNFADWFADHARLMR